MTQPLLYVLLNEIPTHPDVARLYGEGQQWLESLAQVIAIDSHWNKLDTPTLIIRSQPTPALGVMGFFDAAQQPRIESLTEQVTRTLRHLRYVDYRQAEQDCEQLAARLTAEIGKEALQEYSFVGIPRGGLIVLGMLAYCLDLKASQLTPNPDRPLVVVDDCTISGMRFGQFLKTCPNERIVFAPLYAHAALREAIVSREDRVEACISAQDLRDFASDYYQDEYPAWRARWQERSGATLYWIGLPEHVCFAWNEPDNTIWNPITETEELGWRIVPGEFCLKNRIQNREQGANIQHQPLAQGHLKPSANVLFGELEEQIIVANIDSGVNLCLTDVAADMWRVIIASPDLDTAAQTLLQLYDVEASTLKDDLVEFAAAMQQQGILAE